MEGTEPNYVQVRAGNQLIQSSEHQVQGNLEDQQMAQYSNNTYPPAEYAGQQPQQFGGPDNIQNRLQTKPTSYHCPYCLAHMTTSIKTRPNASGWVSMLICCGGGLIFGCCLIPLCFKDCKNVLHSCSNCQKFIGTCPANEGD